MSIPEIEIKNLVVREETNELPEIAFEISSGRDSVQVTLLIDGRFHSFVEIEMAPVKAGEPLEMDVVMGIRRHNQDRDTYLLKYVLFSDQPEEESEVKHAEGSC